MHFLQILQPILSLLLEFTSACSFSVVAMARKTFLIHRNAQTRCYSVPCGGGVLLEESLHCLL